jgi:hypothetical protein
MQSHNPWNPRDHLRSFHESRTRQEAPTENGGTEINDEYSEEAASMRIPQASEEGGMTILPKWSLPRRQADALSPSFLVPMQNWVTIFFSVYSGINQRHGASYIVWKHHLYLQFGEPSAGSVTPWYSCCPYARQTSLQCLWKACGEYFCLPHASVPPHLRLRGRIENSLSNAPVVRFFFFF